VALVGGGLELVLLPEVRGEVAVGVSKGVVSSLDEVTHRLGVSTGGGVGILESSHGQQLLRSRGSDEAGSTGSGDDPEADGSAGSSDLDGDSVGLSGLATPETAADGDDGGLGGPDGSADGGGDFSGSLDSESNVAVGVSDGDEGLETSALTSSRLLLDGHNLHDLILEGVLEEVIDDLVLLDGQGVAEDLLQGADLAGLDQAAELGHGDPVAALLLVLAPTARSASRAVSSTSAALAVTTALTISTALTALTRGSSISHFFVSFAFGILLIA